MTTELKRHVIDMDGSKHGPFGAEDCQIEDPDPELEDSNAFFCGRACGCGVGVIHWQPVYGGYYFECDACETTGLNPNEVVEKSKTNKRGM